MSELTAALATIEKCREITNCPAGVDLQDWVKQLVAENVGLKEYRPEPCGIAMMEALDSFFADEEVPERAMMAAFEILCAKRMPTPATNAAIAGIKADGVEGFVSNTVHKIFDESDAGSALAYLSLANAYVKQLREGADK